MGVSRDAGWQPLRPPGRTTDTGVTCPRCSGGELTLRLSCLSTRFVCPACRQRFDLGQLLRLVTPADFERLAVLVEGRLSDRI